MTRNNVMNEDNVNDQLLRQYWETAKKTEWIIIVIIIIMTNISNDWILRQLCELLNIERILWRQWLCNSYY